MLPILHFLQTPLSFLAVIFLLVFVHEMGHYLVAKLCGVRIETFSIGFGRELWGRNDKSGTRWRISAIPLGGYVKMFGDASEYSSPSDDVDTLPEAEKRFTFYHKSLLKKTAIVAAGPIANFILSIVIFTVFIAMVGLSSTEPVVGGVVENSAAQAAGLQAGDRIIAIDDETVDTFNDIPRIIFTNLGTPVTLKIKRSDKTFPLTLTPKMVTEQDALGNTVTHPLIGIKSREIKMQNVGLPRAVWEATLRTYNICSTNLRAIGQIITGKRNFGSSVTGPIGIAKMSGEAANEGIGVLFMLMAYLSANLGLINLFPIPVLDGGHLLYYAIEAARGKPMARKFQEYGLRVGMAFIAMLMTYVIINDIHKWLLTLSKHN
ncbi:MAG TPA: RIP metalloprotease RseP [Rickettsiales bacterium]|nr:RIP metalloprotease RseP [Rickettsiales bacterium]